MPVKLKPIPKTYEEALARIITGLSEEERAFIKSNDASSVHYSLGMGLRNAWNLWGSQPKVSTELRDHMKERFGLGCADDLSGLLLDHAFAIVNDGYFNIEAEVEYYKNYWINNYKIDPLTQTPLPEEPTPVVTKKFWEVWK